LKLKHFLPISILMLILLGSATLVYSQSSNPDIFAVVDFDSSDLVFVSTTQIDFIGEVNEDLSSISFSVYGLSEEDIRVRIYANDLYDSDKGITISEDKITLSDSNFSLPNAEERKVDVSLESQENQGVYLGSLVVVATANNGNSTSTKIDVKATIKTPDLSLSLEEFRSFISSNEGILMLLILGLSVLGVLCPESLQIKIKIRREKYVISKIHVVFLAAIFAVIIWVFLILNYDFGGLRDAVAAAIITPYLGYTAAYLADKRKQRIAREDTSIEIRNTGIKDDIDLMRNVLGELTTHFASFTPDYYKPPENPNYQTKTSKLLFNKGNGDLSRKVWDESTKQGKIAYITVLEIEKYYEFIDLYNKYYSCGNFLSEILSIETFEEILDTPFFVKFKSFRKSYAKLETVLFVNMSYYLGLFNHTTLLPLKVNYPLITRTLLKTLVDYKVLIPSEGQLKITPENEEEKFVDNFNKKYPKKFHGCELKKIFSDDDHIDDFDEVYKKKFDEEKLNEEFKKATTKLNFVQWKEKHKNDFIFDQWKKQHKKNELIKARIEEFRITASVLEEIIDQIFDENSVPKFYCRVESDFDKKYRALRYSINDLVHEAPLPKVFLNYEKLKKMLKESENRGHLLTEISSLRTIIKTAYNKPATPVTTKISERAKDKMEDVYNQLILNIMYLDKNVKRFDQRLKQLKKKYQNDAEKYKSEKTKALKELIFDNKPPNPPKKKPKRPAKKKLTP